MTEFREVFTSIFSCRYPGAAIALPVPRLRFELAHGPERTALQEALRRCVSLLDAVRRRDEAVWVELCFWQEHSCLAQVQALENHGLCPLGASGWEREHYPDPGGEPDDVEHRFSALIPSASRGFDSLFRAIIWGDHGGYENLSVRALIVAPTAQFGFSPYDDRGADLFAAKAESLLPLYREFESWILDFDRSRIEAELGLDHGA